MPTVTNQSFRRSGCYLGETAALNIVNKEIRIKGGSGKLLPGRVLGKVAGTQSDYVPHDAALNNGGQTADAILFHPVDATAGDVITVATTRGPATINGNDIEFKAGISDTDKNAALSALHAKGLAVLPQHAV